MVEERPLNLGKGWLEKRDERDAVQFRKNLRATQNGRNIRPSSERADSCSCFTICSTTNFFFSFPFFFFFTTWLFIYQRKVSTPTPSEHQFVVRLDFSKFSLFPSFIFLSSSLPSFERNEGRQSERRVDVMRPRLQVEFHFGILPTFANSAKRAFRKRAIDRLGNASQPEAG